MSEKVSIIIPSFGDGSNPRRAINSVFNQSYENVEVIFVDDNGKDTNQQKKNEEELKDLFLLPNFKYIINERNMGGSASRNIGVANSSGYYVCFLDDDDEFIDCNKISKQVEISSKLNDEYAGTFSSLHIFNGKKKKIIKAKKNRNFLINFLRGSTSIGTAAPIIKRKCFDSIGGFDPSFIRHQDWEFFARLIDNFKLYPVSEVYYNRYYKQGVAKKPADIRLKYMDHFAESMRINLHSISSKRIEKELKRKYKQVVFVFFREKRFKDGINVCRKNKYNFFDYIGLFCSINAYFLKKIF